MAHESLIDRALTHMKPEDLRLVHVIWGQSQALVAMSLDLVLVTACDSKSFKVPPGTPTMNIEYGTLGKNGTWDDVPAFLLKHGYIAICERSSQKGIKP